MKHNQTNGYEKDSQLDDNNPNDESNFILSVIDHAGSTARTKALARIIAIMLKEDEAAAAGEVIADNSGDEEDIKHETESEQGGETVDVNPSRMVRLTPEAVSIINERTKKKTGSVVLWRRHVDLPPEQEEGPSTKANQRIVDRTADKEEDPWLSSLMSHFSASYEKEQVLRALWDKAKADGGRGIPRTESFDSYMVESRGGPEGEATVYNFDGRQHRLTPPRISRCEGNGVTLAAWGEFEAELLGATDGRSSPEDRSREANRASLMETSVRRATGAKFVEGGTTAELRSKGVPPIKAETAREVLRREGLLLSWFMDENELTQAPLSWIEIGASKLGKKGGVHGYNERFRRFCRAVHLSEIKLGRRGRLAMARLLTVSPGLLERRIFDIGFWTKVEPGGLIEDEVD